MSFSKDAMAKVCEKMMHETLRLGLAIDSPGKVVDFTELPKLEGCKCTGYLMLFFTEDSVTGYRGVLSQAAGFLSPKAKLMLLQYYPKIFENLFGTGGRT